MRLLCKVGIHKWEYFGETTYCIPRERDFLIEPRTYAYRYCSCGKRQVEDTHYLGVKPPQYLVGWRTINKPILKSDKVIGYK